MKPYFWALFAAFSWGFAPILEKFGLAKVSVYAGLFCRCLGVVIGLLILLAFRFEEIKYTFSTGNLTWLFLVGGGFLASVIGQMFFYNALKDGDISQVVTIGASYPLISFVLGVIFFGEALTWGKVSGLGFVIMGVLLLK